MKTCRKWELKAHAYKVLLISVISAVLLGGGGVGWGGCGSSSIKQGRPELGAKCLICLNQQVLAEDDGRRGQRTWVSSWGLAENETDPGGMLK